MKARSSSSHLIAWMPSRCASGAKISSVSLAFSCCLCLRHRADRPHVVQAVGELDQDDPDVAGHRDHHLPVVLRLAVVAALEGDAGQLRDAVDELGDLLAELLAHLVERRARVLDRVVQQRGAQRGRVEPHAGADLRHADRVDDEVLAARPALVGVALAGEDEGALDELAVDLLGGLAGVLLDDREQVAEQDALVVRELGRRAGGGVDLVAIHGPVAEVRLRRGLRGGRSSASRAASSWWPCAPSAFFAVVLEDDARRRLRRGLLGPLLGGALPVAARQLRHGFEFRAAPSR